MAFWREEDTSKGGRGKGQGTVGAGEGKEEAGGEEDLVKIMLWTA